MIVGELYQIQITDTIGEKMYDETTRVVSKTHLAAIG